MKPFFLVLDGPDGAGKTTQALRTVRFLQGLGLVVEHLRDPGGTRIGEGIREILLHPEHRAMDGRTETLLYLAARVQLVVERIGPALRSGACVVCERFVYSTVAYQGARGTLAPETIWRIWEAISPGIRPDLVLLLDLDPAKGLARLAGSPDRMESLGVEFHRRVYEGFLAIARAMPDLLVTIRADRGPDEVQEEIRRRIRERFRVV